MYRSSFTGFFSLSFFLPQCGDGCVLLLVRTMGVRAPESSCIYLAFLSSIISWGCAWNCSGVCSWVVLNIEIESRLGIESVVDVEGSLMYSNCGVVGKVKWCASSGIMPWSTCSVNPDGTRLKHWASSTGWVWTWDWTSSWLALQLVLLLSILILVIWSS